MNELVAFILPPATALAGARIGRLVLGAQFESQFGFGFRFAFGLAVGMLIFTQALLLFALAGINAAFLLAWVAIIWGIVEGVLSARKIPAELKGMKFTPAYMWLILLMPLVWSWWVFGRLSTLEGTLEFDANAFWVFKSKILFLKQGGGLIQVLRDVNLGYAHMDYPMLVPCLYTLGYGAVGQVDEFINKVWPFWMMVALCGGILSLGRVWKNPRPLPIAVVTLIAFLPASLEFIRNEGGTIPMVFYTSMAVLLIASALYSENECAPAALVLVLAGCFSTKFEGAIFAVFCACAVLPFALRRGWLGNKALLKSAIVAAICVLPYLFYRLAKPVPNVESAWLHTGMTEPGAVAHRYPQVWFLEVFARFFSPDFFQWQANNDHLQWSGHWAGLSSFLNDQISALPWLLIALLVISIIYKSRGRPAIAVFSAVSLGVFSFLALVVSCLQKNSLSEAIAFTLNVVGRYYYPFFTAWFLGVAALWFIDEKSAPEPALQPEKNPSMAPPQKPKRRR
jgi:hypothetical protein